MLTCLQLPQIIPKKIILINNCSQFITKYRKYINTEKSLHKIENFLKYVNKNKFNKYFHMYKPFYEEAHDNNNIRQYLLKKNDKIVVIFKKYLQSNNISYIIEYILPNLLLFLEYNKNYISINEIKILKLL